MLSTPNHPWYPVYTRQAEVLRQLEVIEEANRGNPVRDDDARD